MKIIVIGNGIGGFKAASTIRQLSRECDITIISRETVPLYSACVLPDYIAGKIPREHTFVKKDSDYRQSGIQTLLGCEAREVDPYGKTVTLDDGRAVPFDRLIFATGSKPKSLFEIKKGVFKLKTLEDADNIIKHNGKKAVVVGSGPAAIEIGIALFHRKYQVTIVARYNQILRATFDLKAADKLRSVLKERGIDIISGERTEAIIGKEQVEAIKTTNKEIECDTLVWAIGMQPEVSLAKISDIEIGDMGGIKVNSHMGTNIPEIYACGDCVEARDVLTGEQSLNLLWGNASRQGSIAAQNIAGIPVEYPGTNRVKNLSIFEDHAVSFGYTEQGLCRFRDIPTSQTKLSDLSIIEHEQGGSYYRLVILGDRCMGGQFINVTRNIGMLWSIMAKGRSIAGLTEIFANQALMNQRPWLHRIKPFFRMR